MIAACTAAALRRELQYIIRRDRHIGGLVRIWQQPCTSMAMLREVRKNG